MTTELKTGYDTEEWHYAVQVMSDASSCHARSCEALRSAEKALAGKGLTDSMRGRLTKMVRMLTKACRLAASIQDETVQYTRRRAGLESRNEALERERRGVTRAGARKAT